MTEPHEPAAEPETNTAEPSESNAPDEAKRDAAPAGGVTPPSYRFMALVATAVLVADALSKWWAEVTLAKLTLQEPSIVLIDDVLTFTLAYNRGGAFGMFAQEDDVWRQPFFLIVSVAAVAFIVSMYRKVLPGQRALRWGLPLVLGGAMGNLADRVAKGKVVDFIDYRADWVEGMNTLIAKVKDGWHITSHWPTFNIADIAICTGIVLMALDMFLTRDDSAARGGAKGDGKSSTKADSAAPTPN